MKREINIREKSRENWIDSLKGTAILLVVLGHAIDAFASRGLLPGGQSAVGAVIYNGIYSFHMPLFLAVSGYLFRRFILENRRKVLKSLVNLILLYFLYEILYILVRYPFAAQMKSTVNLKQILQLPYRPSGPYWYFWVLIVYYLVFGLILPRRWTVWAGLLGVAANIVSNVWMNVLDENVYRLCYYALFFFIGTQFGAVLKKVPAFVFNILTVVSAAAIVVGICCFEKQIRRIPFLNTAVAAVCVFSLLGIAAKRNMNVSVLSFFGRNSLPIYVWHVFFVTAVCVLCSLLGFGGMVWVCLTAVISVAGSFGVLWVCRKLKCDGILFSPGKVLFPKHRE